MTIEVSHSAKPIELKTFAKTNNKLLKHLFSERAVINNFRFYGNLNNVSMPPGCHNGEMGQLCDEKEFHLLGHETNFLTIRHLLCFAEGKTKQEQLHYARLLKMFEEPVGNNFTPELIKVLKDTKFFSKLAISYSGISEINNTNLSFYPKLINSPLLTINNQQSYQYVYSRNPSSILSFQKRTIRFFDDSKTDELLSAIQDQINSIISSPKKNGIHWHNSLKSISLAYILMAFLEHSAYHKFFTLDFDAKFKNFKERRLSQQVDRKFSYLDKTKLLKQIVLKHLKLVKLNNPNDLITELYDTIEHSTMNQFFELETKYLEIMVPTNNKVLLSLLSYSSNPQVILQKAKESDELNKFIYPLLKIALIPNEEEEKENLSPFLRHISNGLKEFHQAIHADHTKISLIK